MSVAAVQRAHGLGVSSLVPEGRAGKPVIEAIHIGYARTCRARGQGWQSIAHQLQVNVIDLRRACGDPSLDPEFAPSARRCDRAGPEEPRETEGRFGPPPTRSVAILRAVADGLTSYEAIAARVGGASVKAVGQYIIKLKHRGYMTGDARSIEGWQVTPLGRRRLASICKRFVP